MSNGDARRYHSPARTRQAEATRGRILDAAEALIRKEGFDQTTIEAIAGAAGVSSQTVFGAFQSKRGIIAGILNRARFGPDYLALISEAPRLAAKDRLHVSAKISRQIYDSERGILDLLRGASTVAPELGDLDRDHEDKRRRSQAPLITDLISQGDLRDGVGEDEARDVFWMLTSRDVYHLLVVDRGWASGVYERWLGGVLVRELVKRRND
jgi:AcrR family transcriptional regulator